MELHHTDSIISDAIIAAVNHIQGFSYEAYCTGVTERAFTHVLSILLASYEAVVLFTHCSNTEDK